MPASQDRTWLDVLRQHVQTKPCVILRLEESDSGLLIFNHVASSIRFIKSLETRTKHETAPKSIAALDDDLTF